VLDTIERRAVLTLAFINTLNDFRWYVFGHQGSKAQRFTRYLYLQI